MRDGDSLWFQRARVPWGLGGIIAAPEQKSHSLEEHLGSSYLGFSVRHSLKATLLFWVLLKSQGGIPSWTISWAPTKAKACSRRGCGTSAARFLRRRVEATCAGDCCMALPSGSGPSQARPVTSYPTCWIGCDGERSGEDRRWVTSVGEAVAFTRRLQATFEAPATGSTPWI